MLKLCDLIKVVEMRYTSITLNIIHEEFDSFIDKKKLKTMFEIVAETREDSNYTLYCGSTPIARFYAPLLLPNGIEFLNRIPHYCVEYCVKELRELERCEHIFNRFPFRGTDTAVVEITIDTLSNILKQIEWKSNLQEKEGFAVETQTSE